MYVSGVPGTGKTATVTAVIRSLQDMSKERQVPQFDFVNLNGMRITEPRQAYVEVQSKQRKHWSDNDEHFFYRS